MFICVCMLLGTSPAQARPPAQSPIPEGGITSISALDLTAARLRYQPDQRRLLLDGEVRLVVGTMELRAERVAVSLDDRERPRRLLAETGVTLAFGKSVGRAGRAEVDLVRRTLRLTDGPRLRWEPLGLTLEGQSILLDLASGQLQVDQARAMIQAQLVDSGTAASPRASAAEPSPPASTRAREAAPPAASPARTNSRASSATVGRQADR